MSLTGSLAREGQLTKEGYQLCQQKVNASGGIDLGGTKKQLQIKYQDDTSEPDTAAQLVDQFNDQGIKLILSSYGSANTEAQAAVIERNGQVMADSAGADDSIFQQGYKRTFAVLSPASEYAASIVKAIDELAKPRPKTIAFLSADDGFSKTGAAGGVAAAKAAGFEALPVQFFPEGSTDVSSALTKIKGNKPDVIIGTVHLEEGVAIVKQSHELGVVPDGFGETVAPPTPDFVKTLGDQAENVLGSSQWTETTKGQDKYFGTAKDYAKDIQAKYGHAPDYHDAEASAACLALVLGAEKAGSTDPDKVRDGIAALDTDSFFGKLKFNDKGQNVYKPMAVIQVQQGKAVTVWPKESAEASFIWPGTGK
jgi:branched-chain amino acid transport system substrate-binding protein